MRYVATLLAAGLLVAVALKSRQADDGDVSLRVPPAEIDGARPDVETRDVPGGTHLRVSYRYAGAVSRARLVFESQGQRYTVQERTDCGRLRASDDAATTVELDGVIPRDATGVCVVLEDETGVRVVPVPLG